MSGILVIAEHRQGHLRPVSVEVIGAAVAAREAGGERVTVAVLGATPATFVDALKLAGVDEIVTVQTANDAFDPDTYQAVAHALIEARKPSLVLLPHTIDTLGYAAPLAVKGNYGFTTDAFGLARDGESWIATRSGYGQKVNMEIEFPGRATVVVTIRPGAFKAPDSAATPEVSQFDAPAVTPRSHHISFEEPVASSDVDIAGAEFITSIGRGIGEETHVEQFRELASSLGATLGCSRPIADSGWLPKAHQVGQSGKTAANCKLYLALGISGSVQHMAGMKHVENIIAVNTDPEASIFSIAKYGIVGDIFDIAEELRGHF
ncbi:electron transfer flavoprotein alpha subunit apoprotein [Paraburkholderia steynii]|uniref:Electron transfer flavoprotein alpha subunit apoprotein n=1 Tax=Paraburkholderia steynii TaxID=1245441 RepID=A0A7Z7B449_9BURK|nr:electron transfer flavoprotein subunit alpha/FixB family protein [Paraburkholderia steynii]SDH28036.1 electron transfer flavoprotein alpha subunit apoprotein [Paraburkholderia steynii]